MKAPRIPFIIALLFISIISFSQEERIKLNVEEGKTYVFESKSTWTEFDTLGNPTIISVTNAKIHVEIEQFDGKNLVFSSKTVSGMYEKPDSKVKFITNWKFPPVVNDVNEQFNSFSVTFGNLSMYGLRYKLDLETNTIEFTNKSAVIDTVGRMLRKKGYDKEFIVNGIDPFKENNYYWQNIHFANQLIVYFNNAVKIDNILKSPILDMDFQLNKNEEFIQGQKLTQPGTTLSKVELSKKHGFPAYYFEAKHDTIRERYGTREKYSRLIEKEIMFEKEFRTEKDLFTFECTVEHPKDSVITLFYLVNPYDFNYTKQVLKLDENNHVSFQTKLEAPSLLFFVNKPIKYSIDFSSTFFYAEPHDSLILNFTDGLNQAPLEISGTNAAINQLLRDIPNVHQLFFPLNVHRANNPEFFTKAQNIVEKFDSYVNESIYKVEDDVIQFLRNELIAIEYFHYFAFLNRYYSNSISLYDESKNTQEINEKNEMVKIAENKIRDFDIHDHYNDYGIFSRKLSIQYFNYYLKNISRIQNPQFNNIRHSVQEEFELGKMILGGSIYYRIMAARITNSITKSMHSYVRPATYELDNAISLIDELIRQSYSEHFKNHLKTFRDMRLNWENENYIPETTFYKPDGSAVKLDEVVKGKPTVLYINLRGDTYRYDFDREAANNPNIRYVMIMEGDNLEKWQDYIERAEPVAEQLLLLNNDTTLDDIFLRSKSLYIIYDKNGKLLEYDVEKHRTTKLAKQSLEQKKELDKSQLQTIVVILLMLLILFTIGLIIWKWRVRQRFRKEEQQRRLRELELTAIRSQMNPHFLFNSLNSVQNLVQQNKGREAHLYLSDFAGLIRKVLQNSEKEEVSLAEELEMVQQYLNLEKLRFNFDYSITVDDKIEKYSTVVPSNILQPVVENAIVHGLNHKSDNRILKIDVQPDNRGLKIIVEDNGIGRVAAAELSQTKNGKGLKLVEERLNVLQQKQGERYHIEIIDFQEDKSGTRVEILIPDDN